MSALKGPVEHSVVAPPNAPSIVHVIGTPGPSVALLAEALRAALPAGRVGGVAIGQGAGAPALAGSAEPVRLVVLVAHPAGTVLQAIAAGRDADEALSAWGATARALLWQAQRHATQHLFIDADEALAAPQALRSALGDWDPVLRDLALTLPAAEAADPVAALLARIATDDDAAAKRLFDDLQARCAVLTAAPSRTEAPDWRTAASHLQHQAALRAEQVQQDVGALRAELKQARDDADSQQARSEALQQDVDELRVELNQAKDDADSRQARSEALQQDVDKLRVELKRALDDAGAWRDRVEALQKAEDDALEWKSRAQSLQSDAELAALQLEQAQEELVAMHGRSVRAAAGVPAVLADAMRILDTVDRPPHRHLHVDLRRARVGARRWHGLEVRIVEHHGRPGLAVFGTGQAPEPIAAWQPSGREQQREYMLFVPSDEAGRRNLATLGASDWQLVVGVVDLLVLQLRRTEGDIGKRWLDVARRLQADLRGLEARLRYDGCTSTPAEGAGSARLVEFSESFFGAQALGHVRLRWDPAQAELAWLAPDGDAPVPLAMWPADATAAMAPAFPIPTGPGGPVPARRAWWGTQPPQNRALLLAVLEALPGAMQRDPATTALTAAAQELHADARDCVRRAGWRTLARRVISRLGGGRKISSAS